MKALQTICSVCLAGLTVTARAEVAVIVTQGEEQDLAATYSSTEPHWAELDPQPVIQTNGTTRTASIPISGLLRFFRLRVVP